jgi:hypothetical protein
MRKQNKDTGILRNVLTESKVLYNTGGSFGECLSIKAYFEKTCFLKRAVLCHVKISINC